MVGVVMTVMTVVAALQQHCSSIAAALQQHCSSIAAALQQHPQLCMTSYLTTVLE
jgi:hypothetical protein